MEISAGDAITLSLIAELNAAGQKEAARSHIITIQGKATAIIAQHILNMPSAKEQLKRVREATIRQDHEEDYFKTIAIGCMNWAYRRCCREYSDPSEIY